MEGDFTVKKMLLSDFMMKFLDSSCLYNCPRIISPFFLDLRLEERMIRDPKNVSYAKHKITNIEDELINFDHQSEHGETWLEVVNLIHTTQHGSWFVGDDPIWYHMAHVADVFDRGRLMCNARCLSPSTCFVSTVWESSKFGEIYAGVEDEEEKIAGKLMREQNTLLDIVTIVGMGGLGKTKREAELCSQPDLLKLLRNQL